MIWTCASGRDWWRRKIFGTLGNSLTGQVSGELQNSEGSAMTGAQKAKQGQCTTEIIAKQHFLAEKRLSCLHPQQRMGGARCQGSGSSVRPQGENWYGCHKDTLRGLVQQRRDSREKTGCLSVARGHCHRDRFKESSWVSEGGLQTASGNRHDCSLQMLC